MNIEEVIINRRSVRSFSDRQVEKETVQKIIAAASQAPSACNVQGWRFIVIDDDKLKQKIVDAGGSVLIGRAPMVILVIYDNQTANFYYHDHIQSAAAATQNLLLTATSLGLGACWICHLPKPRTLQKILKVPSHYSPMACVLIGYPLKAPVAMPRKNKVEDLINYNVFSAKWQRGNVKHLTIFVKRVAISIYYLMPTFVKKHFLNKLIDKKFVKKFDN